MGCREVGFWFGGAFCTVEFHLSLGHQKAALGFFFRCGFGWFGLVSRRCLAVSHGLPRGWFLVWRCVLHGRVSSFFRASESSVRQFFCGAVLAGLGSCLGGVWLFRMGRREVGFWCGGAFCTVEFHLSLGHQKAALGFFFAVWRCVLHGRVSSFFRASESSVRQFFCGAVLAGLGSCRGGVWLFRMGCRGLVFGLEVRFARSSFIFL